MKLFVSMEDEVITVITDLISMQAINSLQLKLKGWDLHLISNGDAWCDIVIEITRDFLIINGIKIEEEAKLEFNGASIYAYLE
jgi:hypothetical protein